jgi:enoyl-CoA hydratase/carnithine racemase
MMSADVQLSCSAGLATVTLSHPGKFNAMSRHMWRLLRSAFETLAHQPEVRCVVLTGANGNFCAGGDISEYADFRFQASSLRDFHENDVWGALQAMLDCEVPLVAAIEGNCMGAGIEMASCCDIRLAGESCRFGAPIARLGFPMAPREAALVARELGSNVTRQLLLEAAILGSADLKACGFLSRVLPDEQVGAELAATVQRILDLSPQAARLNKRTLRDLHAPGLAACDDDASYLYADSAEHREGILAFLEKRRPAF